MTLKKLYKNLMLLAIVIGPIYWLLMTDDGRRRTDAVVLSLLGQPGIDFNLKALDNQFTRDDLKKVYPDIEWQCKDQTTSYGNNLCVAQLGAFNGVPAHFISVMFGDQHINALKLMYRDIYHEQMIQQMLTHLGQPEGIAGVNNSTPVPDAVLRWDTGSGVVIMKQELADGEEASLFWLSASLTRIQPDA